ncbi:MAG: hypothetical protein LBR84_09980 [Tannerella sp.]|jgi:hypothetical protein|nr:hypothetical protein [Tannerella sp.]
MDNFDFEVNMGFVELIKKTVPEKYKLTKILVDLLDIEPNALYRRMRNDTTFSIGEMVKIAKLFGFSLDSLLGVKSPIRSQFYQMSWLNYFKLGEVDYFMSESFVDTINTAAKNVNSELGVATTGIPLHILAFFPNIFRFFILKWMFQFGNVGEVKSFSDIKMDSRIMDGHLKYREAIKKIGYTFMVCDENALQTLMNDIHYFNTIRLVTEKDVAILKEDLSEMLDLIEKVVTVGAFENGNEVELYTSNVSFETTYSYLYSDNINVSRVDVFTIGSMTSVDADSCEHMRKWLHSIKRTSTLISGIEINRIQYMDRQRRILDSL